MKKVLLFIFCLLFLVSCGKVIQQSSGNQYTITNAIFDPTKISIISFSVDVDGQTVAATQEIVSNQVIVTLSSGKTKTDLENELKPLSCSIVGENTLVGTYQIQIPGTENAQTYADTLAALNSVEKAGVNPISYPEIIPDDANYSTGSPEGRWPFESINAEAAWDITTGEATDKIGLVDSGIYVGSRTGDEASYWAEIGASRIVAVDSCDKYENDSDPYDESDSHATNVLGILAAKGNNQKYMAGMNWNCKVYPFRSSSSWRKEDWQTRINAASMAVLSGVKVINCSFGLTLYSTLPNHWPAIYQFQQVAAKALEREVLIVCSAGNNNQDAKRHYPSCLTGSYASIISVGGLDVNNARYVHDTDISKGSNYGDYVDVAAPGKEVPTLDTFGFASLSGTSLSAPMVTGTASLMFSLSDKNSWGLTVAKAKEILKSTSYSDSITTDKNIGRKLNAYKALLGTLALGNQAVVSISSNVSGAAIYISYNSGSTYTDTGYVTSATEPKRIVIASGSSFNYKFKTVLTNYSDAASDVYSSVAAGAEVPITLTMTKTSATFSYNSVDTSINAKYWTSLGFDSSGNPRIAYFDDTNGKVKCAFYSSSSGWSKKNVHTVDANHNMGDNTGSLAVDSSNYVHISYYDYDGYDLNYSKSINTSGSSWQLTTVSSLPCSRASMAIDSNNKVHIAFYEGSKMDLNYATNASGSWVTTSIDSTGTVGNYPSLKLDSNDNAHISYYDYTNKNLKYATNSSGVWVTSTIVSTGDVGQYSCLDIDSSNNIHIVYFDATNNYIMYVNDLSGSWAGAIIDSATVFMPDLSFVLDSSKHGHVVYYDTAGKFKYATNSSGGWVKTTLMQDTDVWNVPSIKVNSSGKVCFSYIDTDYNLYYATEN